MAGQVPFYWFCFSVQWVERPLKGCQSASKGGTMTVLPRSQSGHLMPAEPGSCCEVALRRFSYPVMLLCSFLLALPPLAPDHGGRREELAPKSQQIKSPNSTLGSPGVNFWEPREEVCSQKSQSSTIISRQVREERGFHRC